MKLLWLGYLVQSLGNCVMKLYIETGLSTCIYATGFEGKKLKAYGRYYHNEQVEMITDQFKARKH